MTECDEIGLSDAVKRLSPVLRAGAIADFWDAIGRGSIRSIDTFNHTISDTGGSRTVALFHVKGDVYWFELFHLRNSAGNLVPVVRSVSIDPLPNKRVLQEQGYYYVE